MEDTRPALLIVDDDADVRLAAELALRPLGQPVLAAATPAEAAPWLQQREVAVLLLDLNFGRGRSDGEEGLAWLAELARQRPQLLVIVVTAHGGVEVAVRAMKLGAIDFVTKPWHNERLLTTVRNALALHASRTEAERQARRAEELAASSDAAGLIGSSPAMVQLRALIERVAPTEANVLILGENGTGKELVAQALHRASARRRAPLVTVDMGTVPAQLFESELFGHRKGAFTDARSDRLGRIAAADGGTLFLDEIGNLPLALQPRLLAVLERRQVQPLGSNSARAVDLRVLAATNLAREALADERQFRADLLYRLNTVEIHVPALRHRRGDIVPLAQHFQRLYARKYGRPERALSEAAQRALAAHDWPGNVRALRHAVERAVVMATGPRLLPEDFALSGHGPARAAPAAEPEDLNLERLSRQWIERALQRHAWNISHAARDLGLTRAALYRRMQRYGL